MGGSGRRSRFGMALVAMALTLLVAATAATAKILKAEAVLPPGQSGYVSITGLPNGTGSPHLTDQTELFKDFELRPFGFDQQATATEQPAPGVTIERDRYGIPNVRGTTDSNAWFGVGYAAAEDRLFELELFRRAGSGRLAEILGSTYLDDDLIARRDYYTDAEIDSMVAAIPPRLRARLVAYRDGINAYIDYLGTHPNKTPGEFVALGVPLTDWTIRDSARVGILLARTVPSGDGNELANAQALQKIGPKGFDFLHPVRTKGRIATVPRSEGVFKAQPGRTAADERKGFRKTRRFLKGIDTSAAKGPGTTPGSAAVSAEPGEQPGDDLARILPHGGSFMWAIRDEDADRAYLFNGPQLGFAIPELFFEFELHSPTQDIRGVSAAGVPLVGIGHNSRVAWGFTSGLSDEDDLFAEKLAGPESYEYKGQTRQMDCRDETFTYKPPPTSAADLLPDLIGDPGAPAGERTERICRTVHGPVQYRGDGYAYARDYAIWGRELETIVGLTQLNDAKDIGDVDKAMRKVTWNENVMAADSAGRIGYWHPGLHPLKPKRWDERLPFPGDGRADWRGLRPRKSDPHVVNPDRNWLVNWNNPPSIGWTNGDGPARERLNGNLHRVRLIQSLVRRVARDPSYAKSRAIEFTSGTTAQQFPFANRAKLRKAKRAARGPGKAALDQLLRWDGNYDRTDSSGTVAPGVAIWERFKKELQRLVLKPYGPAARILAGATSTSHEYDITNGEAIGLRTLGPRLYARAANRTGKKLGKRFGTADASRWRDPRLMYEVTAQGAGAPPDLPFFDRGTWSQSLAVGRR